MMLQKICDTVGGRSEPVRRKRYAQWNPNKLVYAVWNTVRHRVSENKRKKAEWDLHVVKRATRAADTVRP